MFQLVMEMLIIVKPYLYFRLPIFIAKWATNRPYAVRFETWEGSSSSHDPFFSRKAASEGSMTVSVVLQAARCASHRDEGFSNYKKFPIIILSEFLI
jgi:hypothetical protein